MYNPNTIKRYLEALKEAKQNLDTPNGCRVSFSKSNSKMGDVPSVSTLALLTCPGICKNTCGAGACYAIGLTRFTTTLQAYARNTAIALYRPAEYFKQIDKFVKGVRFFRWHVSGDIINKAYFENMVEIARNNPHCIFLAYTKRFYVVNNYLNAGGSLPKNFKLLFSGWHEMSPNNPHGLPETNVYNDDNEKLPRTWKKCTGDCFKCAITKTRCYGIKKGQTLAFKMH